MTARLQRDETGEAQQFRVFGRMRLGLLAVLPAQVDALGEIHRAAAAGIEGRMARRRATHAGGGVAVAAGAGFASAALGLVPECFAPLPPRSTPGRRLDTSSARRAFLWLEGSKLFRSMLITRMRKDKPTTPPRSAIWIRML